MFLSNKDSAGSSQNSFAQKFVTIEFSSTQNSPDSGYFRINSIRSFSSKPHLSMSIGKRLLTSHFSPNSPPKMVKSLVVFCFAVALPRAA
ncbi:MAG: hypothetical protein LBC02_08315 [Planctomycetaceae bacterium]|nr:hypothetical protein [Planctomycetaceae bacterium]